MTLVLQEPSERELSADYFDADGINWSTLKAMRESPKAYLYAAENDREDKISFMVGRAVHTKVFEPDLFDAEFAIWTEGDRRGNAWKAFAEAHASKTILKTDEMILVDAMVAAVRNDPVAKPFLSGVFERPIFWIDPTTGLLCKARPDMVDKFKERVVDLKTCRSIDPRRFGNDCARLGYHLQMTHYSNGVKTGLGWEPKEHVLIAVEKAPPHDVGVFLISAVDIGNAAEEVAALLVRVLECTEDGAWPGRFSEVQELQIPSWVNGDVEIEEIQ
jgi:exodeoxyribonuclease VIII